MIIDGGDADPWDYSTIGTTVDETFSGIASNAVAVGHYALVGRGGVVKAPWCPTPTRPMLISSASATKP